MPLNAAMSELPPLVLLTLAGPNSLGKLSSHGANLRNHRILYVVSILKMLRYTLTM